MVISGFRVAVFSAAGKVGLGLSCSVSTGVQSGIVGLKN